MSAQSTAPPFVANRPSWKTAARKLLSPIARAISGSACARIVAGSAAGSSPNRIFGPTRGSSITGPVICSSVVVPPFGVVAGRGGSTRLLPRLRSISAPEDNRSSGRLRRFGGSLARSMAGPFWPCWLRATEAIEHSAIVVSERFTAESR